MELIKKACEHIQKNLKLVDTYQVYVGVRHAIDELQLPEDIRKSILDKLSDRASEYVHKPVQECKEWIETILTDLNKTKA